MILTTSYNQMTYTSGSEKLYPYLETFTGNRILYGMATPISVRDIIVNCGLSLGLNAYSSAFEDTVALSKTIGLALLRANLGLWRLIMPNNTQPEYLLSLCDDYAAAIVLHDMCGEEVTLPDPSLAILDAITMLTDSVATLGDTVACPDTYMWLPCALGDPLTEAEVQARYGSAYHHVAYSEDPNFLQGFPPMIWYNESSITSELRPEIDGYVKQSNRMMEERTTSSRVGYQLIRYQFTQDALVNTRKEAARLYVEALRSGAYQVIYEVECLAAIALMLNQSYSNYLMSTQADKEALFGIAGDLGQGRMLVVSDALPQAYQDMQAEVVRAYNNELRRLLRDETYIRTFDADVSGGLNLLERQALETGARAKAKDAAVGIGGAQRDSINGSYNTLPVSKQIENIVLEYVT
jgi:hypothetical protein